MNKNVVILLIRLALSAWLCFLIYEESGPFTAFGFALVVTAIECITAIMRQAVSLAASLSKHSGR